MEDRMQAIIGLKDNIETNKVGHIALFNYFHTYTVSTCFFIFLLHFYKSYHFKHM